MVLSEFDSLVLDECNWAVEVRLFFDTKVDCNGLFLKHMLRHHPRQPSTQHMTASSNFVDSMPWCSELLVSNAMAICRTTSIKTVTMTKDSILDPEGQLVQIVEFIIWQESSNYHLRPSLN